MRAGYMGCVTHIDYQLGYLMERMRSELGEDVLWIFTADHGDMQGDHYLMRKSYAYEGSARIPMVIRYPKGLDLPSGTFKQPVGLQDVMPTILDAAGVSIPDSVTGQSLLDAVRGKPWRDFIHGEHSSCYSPENAMHYLTDGQTKYIWFPVTGQEQLFDLAHDRQELHDLAGDPAWSEERVRWRDRLIDLLAERGDGFSDGERLIERPGGYGPEAQ
jgi:arylsulfatase A-like enzyme